MSLKHSEKGSNCHHSDQGNFPKTSEKRWLCIHSVGLNCFFPKSSNSDVLFHLTSVPQMIHPVRCYIEILPTSAAAGFVSTTN